MSPSDPQSRRNGQRSGMPLTDQFRADLVIELRILLQFPLAEKLNVFRLRIQLWITYPGDSSEYCRASSVSETIPSWASILIYRLMVS